MPRLSLVLAVPVACVFACGDATQPAPSSAPSTIPVFSVSVPHGAAVWTSCTEAEGNYATDPHALESVQEYGVGRWAPAVSADAWAAQRTAGIHLRGTPGDVQLVLSAGETSGSGSWTLLLIRGPSREAVQARADEVHRALR